MKKLDWNYVPIAVIFALSMALAPVFRAQDQGSLTRITPVPGGAEYLVDGQTYTACLRARCGPTGSKHDLWVRDYASDGPVSDKYIFRAGNSTAGRLRPIR